ncbi:MAG: hypothetical protein FWF90_05580 [Promicromonosporaceae bacterium]|nr:hypothetical protein [Promicromonosporaceae bacterium]
MRMMWLFAPFLIGFWLLLVAAIVWLSIALAKALRERRAAGGVAHVAGGAAPVPGTPAGETPLATLQRRLALGEVDVETYERSVAALQRTETPGTPPAPPAPGPETTGDVR